MTKRAFLFDMDGVIVNSEVTWSKHGMDFAERLYGKDILEKMGDMVGASLDHEYAEAKKHGFAMDLDEYYRRYDEQAAKMYALSSITDGLADLINFLKTNEYTTGIVSSSRRPWIEFVLEKIGDRSLFDYTISLNEAGLLSKPAPDGYIRAMKDLGIAPESTIILEDSNNGIRSAKDSGAFVIGFTPHLVEGYAQTVPANAVAKNFKKVKEIVEKRK